MAHGGLRFNERRFSIRIPELLNLPNIFSLLYFKSIYGFPHFFVCLFEIWLNLAFNHVEIFKVNRVLLIDLLLHSLVSISCLVAKPGPFLSKLIVSSQCGALARIDKTHFLEYGLLIDYLSLNGLVSTCQIIPNVDISVGALVPELIKRAMNCAGHTST